MLFKATALVVLFVLGASAAAPPVRIDLYYESLCPYCHDFVTSQLYPTWMELKDIMDVHLFPFGNAQYAATDDEGWSFTCQHGAQECRGNMILACAHNHIADFDVEMDFVNCLLSSDYPPNAGQDCASKHSVEWAPIEQCLNSVEGEKALHAVAVQQEQLSPALYFVPWILVDETFSEAQVTLCQTNLKRVVCNRYTGTPPDACNDLRPSGGPHNKMMPRRSYKEH